MTTIRDILAWTSTYENTIEKQETAATTPKMSSSGTSEGAMKGWDSRGRKSHEVLQSSGFHYRGTDSGLARYTGKTTGRHDPDTGKEPVMQHTVWVDKQTGAWAHEYGPYGTNSASGRGGGGDHKSLDQYIGSGKFMNTHAHSRSGPVWRQL